MSGTVDAVSVIRAKRDGAELTDEEIDWAVAAYTAGEVAEEQMAALAMAILLRGMTRREIARWTEAMIRSGERLSFAAELDRPTVDKHSTGGVGDKITLPLAPLVAACGAAVPQLSGRGLGHTGGTLDKLESIPGWRAELTTDRLTAVLRDVGCAVCAAGSGLAPADRKLYALRDVTGTVESIPLIASSIMSKKIAEGTGALVLDVKCGSGAFMKDLDSARELAATMVELGNDSGVRTTALITDMSTPLGRAVGNAVEVAEAVEVLAGGGPSDVVELTLALAREMLSAAGLDAGHDPADVLKSGAAMDRWRRMIRAQGGDPDAPLPAPARPTPSPRTGRAWSPPSTPTPWAWPPGASAPAAPARRTPSSRRPASSSTPAPATGSPPAAPSAPSTPTPRPRSPAPCRPSPTPRRSPRRARAGPRPP